MNSIFAGLPLLVVVLVFSPACAQGSCTCPGQLVDNFNGGNGTPLEWQFAVNLIKAGDNTAPPLYCYLKEVANKSGSDVYAVKWEIAHYKQDIIYHDTTLPTCPQYLQSLAPSPVNGPLNFGISSQHYDTTVKTPTGGWPELSDSAKAGIEIKPGYDWPPLVSEFAFSTVNKSGERGIGSVSVESRVSFKDDRAYLYYLVANSGRQAASVLINLATDKEEVKLLPIASNFVRHCAKRHCKIPNHDKRADNNRTRNDRSDERNGSNFINR